jgi:hypothetical protein
MLGCMETDDKSGENINQHKSRYNWILWAHSPQDPDWSLKSYKRIYKVTSMECHISLMRTLPSVMVKNCMLFFMRESIQPQWDDVKNRQGGCFSYKVLDKNICETWNLLSFVLTGDSISDDKEFNSKVTGITISPKKKFCIIKIWMSDCSNQNPMKITNKIKDIIPNGCLFKKHVPEY